MTQHPGSYLYNLGKKPQNPLTNQLVSGYNIMIHYDIVGGVSPFNGGIYNVDRR